MVKFSRYISGLKIFIVFIVFSLLISPQIRGEDFVNLSGLFIDSAKYPLIIQGNTFPGSVIYQNNTMYAPAGDFVYYLGVTANFSGLPSQLFLNNQPAPLSLMAIGPDRKTNENVYYMNVTATLDYLGISYTATDQGGNPQITTGKASTASSSPNPATAAISGQVISYRPFNQSDVFLEKSFLNTARIPETKVVATAYLTLDGRFVFTGLEAGDYTVTARCYYRDQSNLYYSYTMQQYYYYLTAYTITWSQNVSLSSGQNLSVTLSSENTTSSQEIKYINSPYQTESVPYNPSYTDPYYPGPYYPIYPSTPHTPGNIYPGAPYPPYNY